MALELSGAEFEAIKDDFITIDQDQDGHIDRKEMLELLDDEKAEHLDFMMTLMDTNGKGAHSFTEFLEIMAIITYNKGVTKRKATQFFRAIDKNKDGVICVDEFKRSWRFFYEITGKNNVANNPTESEIDALVQSLDTDHDGKLNLEEFLTGFDKFLNGTF